MGVPASQGHFSGRDIAVSDDQPKPAEAGSWGCDLVRMNTSKASHNRCYRSQWRHQVWNIFKKLLVQQLRTSQKQWQPRAWSQGMLGNSLVTFRSGGVIYYFLEEKKIFDFGVSAELEQGSQASSCLLRQHERLPEFPVVPGEESQASSCNSR